MWRVVNFRSFLLTMVCCVLSALVCSIFAYSVALLISAVFATAFLLWGILSLKKETAVRCAAFFLCFVCIVTVSAQVLVDKTTRRSELEDGAIHEISAVIDTKNLSVTGATLLLTDVINAEREIDGKISLRVYATDGKTLEFLQEGDEISLSASTTFVFPYESPSENGYLLKNDIRYYAEISENEIKFVAERAKLFTRLRNKISYVFDANLGEYGSLAYGMITGKSGEISDEVRSYYSASGLGHILAVSGLHIGFITLVLNFILNKLKSVRWVKLSVVSAVLLFYCFIAGFSPSVVRASVMCIIGLAAHTLGKNPDGLSSLSFAVTLILLVKPMYIYDAGFVMSVSAVLGLLFFSTQIERALSFLPDFLCKSLSASLSAQIGITPITIAYFGTFPTYSVLTNLLMIPLITVTFIALTITLLFTLIFAKAGILISFVGILLALVDTVAKLVSLLPFAEIRVFSFSLIVGALLVFFLCGKYFMLPRFKWLVVVGSVVLCMATLVVYNLPLDRKYDFATKAAYDDVTVVVRTENGVALVGDCSDYYSANEMLTALKERSVDAVFLTSCSEKTAGTISALAKRYGIGTVYFPTALPASEFQLLLANDIEAELLTPDSQTEFVSAVFTDGGVAYKYTEEGVSVLILGKETKITAVPLEVINECAIIRAASYYGSYGERVFINNFHNDFVSDSPEREILLKGKAYAMDLCSGRAVSLQ